MQQTTEILFSNLKAFIAGLECYQITEKLASIDQQIYWSKLLAPCESIRAINQLIVDTSMKCEICVNWSRSTWAVGQQLWSIDLQSDS